MFRIKDKIYKYLKYYSTFMDIQLTKSSTLVLFPQGIPPVSRTQSEWNTSTAITPSLRGSMLLHVSVAFLQIFIALQYFHCTDRSL